MKNTIAHEIAAAMIDTDTTETWDNASIVDFARELGITLDVADAPAVWTVYEALAFGHD